MSGDGTSLGESVTQFLQDYVKAEQGLGSEWSQEKHDAYCNRFYEPDMVFIRPSGNPLDLQGFKQMFASGMIKDMTNALVSVDSVKALEASVAVATYTCRQKFTYDGTTNDDLVKVSLVLHRDGGETDGGWRIAHGHRATGQKPQDPASSLAAAVATDEQAAAVVKRITEGYKAFGEGDVEHLANYFTEDCLMTPMFPVAGWKPVKNFGPMMEQFGAMQTDANPGVQDFKPVPYLVEVSRCGKKAFVHEEITTKQSSFRGMAVHHYNDEGKCFKVEPYHDSAKMSSNGN